MCKSILGDSSDLNKLKDYKITEFSILETVYADGRVEIKSWKAKVMPHGEGGDEKS